LEKPIKRVEKDCRAEDVQYQSSNFVSVLLVVVHQLVETREAEEVALTVECDCWPKGSCFYVDEP